MGTAKTTPGSRTYSHPGLEYDLGSMIYSFYRLHSIYDMFLVFSIFYLDVFLIYPIVYLLQDGCGLRLP